MAEILLIEDNPADVLLTKEAFKECVNIHNITAVKDGIEALHHLKALKENYYPDLILLDLNLPRKDGRQVLSEIKGDELLKNIPVLILSTSRNEQDVLTSYELKANCYIIKPVELEEFIDIVKSIESFWFNMVKLPNCIKNES